MILAMRDGKVAAAAIHDYLMKKKGKPSDDENPSGDPAGLRRAAVQSAP